MKFITSFLILAITVIGLSQVNVEARSNTAPDTTAQKKIERKVFKEIIKLPFYGVFDNIAYKVDGDTVTLLGSVRNAINRKAAEHRVERIAGVKTVVNNIKVLSVSRFDDSIRLRTLRDVSRGGSLYRYFLGVNPSIRIVVDRGHVTLTGFVRNKGDSNLANILANGVPGTFSVTNKLVVTKDINP